MKLERGTITRVYNETAGKISSLKIDMDNGNWRHIRYERDETNRVTEKTIFGWKKRSNTYLRLWITFKDGIATKKAKAYDSESVSVLAGKLTTVETKSNRLISETVYKYEDGEIREIEGKEFDGDGEVSVLRQEFFLRGNYVFGVLTKKGETPQVKQQRVIAPI